MAKFHNPLIPAKKKTVTYNFTEEQLRQYQDAAQREGYTAAIYVCNAMYTAAMLTSMREAFGFGQKRLKKIHDKIQKNFRAIMDGDISYQDVAQALMDECRINLIIERPDGTLRDAMEIFKAAAETARHKLRIEVKK